MKNEHEDEQDRRIAANSAAIEQMVDYMRELRDHFEPISAFVEKVPVRWKASMRLLRAVIGFGAVAAVLVKGGLWYYNRRQLEGIADRYMQVAQDLYYTENNPDVALPFVEKALAINDENPDYLYFRDYIQGMSVTRNLLNLDRPFTKAELDLAHRAYADARLLERIAPNRAESYILQGQILAALKETARAHEAVLKAVDMNPNSDFAWLRLAMVQLDEKDVKGAKESLARAESINQSAKWTWLWKGIVARECDKDIPAARACYERALELDPRFDMAHYNLGWTYMDRSEKKYARARECFLKALNVNPDYKEACYAIGMSYGYEDNYPIGIVWMDKALAIDASFLSAHKWRGIMCGELGQYADGIRSFDAAILLDPMNAELYVRRARMEESLDRDADALRDLRFAYELEPKSKRTLLYLGDVYLKAGDCVKALDYYDRALALDAAYDEALGHKANALAAAGRVNETLVAIDQAIAAAKYKPQKFWMQKGAFLEKAGRRTDALACYVKARTIDAKLADAWRKEAALQKGTDDAAYRAALRAYVELVPADAEARRELER